MRILNLTQHPASPAQIEAGVINLSENKKNQLVELITFENLPDISEINARAQAVAALVAGMPDKFTRVMIGGAPFFMSALETALKEIGVTPMYAFSRRMVVESEDGAEKRVVFKHEGFVGV